VIVTELLLTAWAVTLAQPRDTILPNPNAKLLRLLWWKSSNPFEAEQRVGIGVGPVGDINSDGYTDFAVRYGVDGAWRIFMGAPSPDTAARWVIQSSGPPDYPGVGDFWGTGHKAIVIGQYRLDSLDIHHYGYVSLDILRTEEGTLDTTKRVQIDPGTTMPDKPKLVVDQILGVDIDKDGFDELVVSVVSATRDGVRSGKGEVWIYRGGATFNVGAPTVILHDDQSNYVEDYRVYVRDFDGDGHLDLMTQGQIGESGLRRLRFYWGTATSPWSWTTPDRVVVLDTATMEQLPLAIGDFDGDGRADFAGTMMLSNGAELDHWMMLSSSGKDVRTRSFGIDDIDRIYHKPGVEIYRNLGSLNDSSQRYEMPGFIGRPEGMIAMSGGPNGPDRFYDAYFSPQAGGLGDGRFFSAGTPCGDVDGDGWNDFITGDYIWYGAQQGIAAVLAGGPYIPRDFTSSVREVAVAGHADGIHLWPNPARDVLNIAWRGDLRHMPFRFEVHDVLGRLVLTQAIESWRGSTLWPCDGVPAGVYILSIFDQHSTIVASSPIQIVR
jgi:hypothetical protein